MKEFKTKRADRTSYFKTILKQQIEKKQLKLSSMEPKFNEEMASFYLIWKKIGYLSLDGKEKLWQFFEKINGVRPNGSMDCDSCVRSTWESFELEAIKFINKPNI